ncbi:MAG: peptidylprolyl isomerase [Gammaproteobacteria bacterium]|nr:peptidylprolyl isomerase [Gammaproteobacteria bacterium]MCF6361961.1 peptidylprolyl isomerase [Gammaproteobacteria bacterium]
MKLHYTVLSLMLTGALIAGCSNDPGDKSVAQVGSKKISQQEYDDYLKFKRVPAQDTDRSERLLDDYLEREAISAQVADSDYIDAQMAEVEVNEFRKQMLISRYFESYLNDRVSEEAVQNYYNTHKGEFQTEQVKVAHILIRTNDKMSEAERKARLTLAQEAYGKARTDKSFEELAEQYSEDKVSAKQGGVIGWIKRGAIDPVFSEKVFSLVVNEISEPFATPFGFHVVKVVEAARIVKTPYEKVKGDIRYRLRQEAKQAEWERLLSQVKIEKK